MRKITFEDDWGADTSGGAYSIIDQAEMMAEWRRQTTEDRLTIRRMALEERRAAQDMELARLESERETEQVQQSQPFYYFFPRPYFNQRPGRRFDYRAAELPPQRPQPKMPPERRLSGQPEAGAWKVKF
jgi:hypothetical protein